MSRIPQLPLDQLSPRQKEVYESIVSGPRGNVAPPFLAWLQSPELADKAQEFGVCCRFDSNLSPRLAELAILMAASFWRCAFEWNGHQSSALESGLSQSMIDTLRIGEQPSFNREDERVVWHFVTELLNRRKVSQSVWLEVEQCLSHQAAVEIIFRLGYYTILSMTANAFEIAPLFGPSDPWESMS